MSLCGFIIDCTLEKFGLVGGSNVNTLLGTDEHDQLYGVGESRGVLTDVNMAESGMGSSLGGGGFGRWKWRNFDDSYMKPLFGGRLEDRSYVPGRYSRSQGLGVVRTKSNYGSYY